MGTFPQSKICHTSNKSDIYLRLWADFFWNFGLAHAAWSIPKDKYYDGATGIAA
jgi:hypothetical protein